MNWDGWFVLILIAVMLYGLTRFSHLADVIFLGGLTLLGLVGILTPTEALRGFSNAGMLTVAALFVVAAGLRDSGALDGIARKLLGLPRSERRTMVRLLGPVGAMSALLNNTTIVAMAMPVVLDWCRKHQLSPSRYLLPLSYMSVAGGIVTLIGTSTNLVVHGFMLGSEQLGYRGMGFLEIGAVGLPLAAITLLYLIYIAPKLLPIRKEFIEQIGASQREYMVEMLVEPICPLIGESVQDAGLRQLPGLFLVEIERDGESIAPVAPDEKLKSGDRLLFVGVVGTIVDLQKIKGLVPAGEELDTKSITQRLGQHLCEAVISQSSPLVGRSIRGANFRTVYDAAIIAVHRNGVRLGGKLGDIVLRPGDTLLLQTASGFLRAHRNNTDFYLVSEVGGAEPVRHERAGIALVILALMVVMMAIPDLLDWFMSVRARAGATAPVARTGLSDFFDRGRVFFALAAAGFMVIFRCVSSATARRNIQWDVLFVIAASFGISTAMEKTGVAQFIAGGITSVVGTLGPIAVIAAVYLCTTVLTEFLTNNAAAALMFPIAMATATKLPFIQDPRALAIVVAVAASAAYTTPMGYQTNLMVFGPGGYKFTDFVKVGLPLNILSMLVSTIIIYWVWPM